MKLPSREFWRKVIVIGIPITVITAVYPYIDNQLLRESVTGAFQASALLFAICATVSLVIIANYVKGLKDSAIQRVDEIRSTLEKLFDKFFEENDRDLHRIVEESIVPLLSLNTEEWLDYNSVSSIYDRVSGPIERYCQRVPEAAARYFLRLENEINELAVLHLRMIIVGVGSRIVRGTFHLVSVGILTLFLIAFLPLNDVGNYLAITMAVSVAIFAVLELQLLVTYLMFNTKNEELE